MKKQIRQAFAPIHASEQTLQEVFAMIDSGRKRAFARSGKAGRVALVAATLTMLLAVTAFATDYILNHREIFFFDTLEALAAAKQSEVAQDQAISYASPGSREENEDTETPSGYVSRMWTEGQFDDEVVLSREIQKDSQELWERRKVTRAQSDVYGDILTEYLIGTAYARRLVVDGLLDWDLSFLEERMTPEQDGQILSVSRDAETGELAVVTGLLGYRTEEGERFQVEYSYNPSFPRGQIPEYILDSAYDQSEIFVTEDSVEVLLQAFDGQIWATAVNGAKSVSLYTTGCTMEEMRSILNQMNLSQVIA